MQIDLRSNYERRADGIGHLIKNAKIVRKHKKTPPIQVQPGISSLLRSGVQIVTVLNLLRMYRLSSNLKSAPAHTDIGLLLLQPNSGRQVSPDPKDVQLIVHHLSLLERSRYYGKFIMSLPFGKAAKIVFWTVLCNQRRAISVAMS